ncbi:MFS transporter [Pseudodesulfovibrio sp. JC047]|uniref:MFS transporter n=1 Tax=Pseudodesulfovibrio sp. JC047 TaxID=2683199 RepID=UPI0013CF9FED|nr:MFS transporter [Pseudodesulfovibrio sp. JC047]NDV20120.1 MFS transporter [Pseudodesulfovibrio sp. JC047]
MTDQLKKRRMYLYLLVLVVGSGIAFQGWRTLLNNFAVDVAGLDGLGMGIASSVREIPGFLALLALYVILILKEHRLAALSVVVTGIGVALTGFFPSLVGIVCTTLVMSFGFHYFETMNQSLTLQYFNYTEAPVVMGRLRSITELTNVSVGAFIYFMAKALGYTEMFAILGAVAILAGLWALTKDPSRNDLPIQHKKMAVKKKYWLFYALTFMSGARRQIFIAFAVFLLVEKFDYSIQQITVLFVCNNIVNYFINPLIGKAVNRFGERAVLNVEYTTLTFVFLGYALTDSAFVAGGFYVLNNVVYNFSMGIKTFFQKIADPKDIAAGMAVGFTINHIAAVFIPVLGGLIWITNYKAVFFGAVSISLISLILTQFIPGQLAARKATS